MKEIHIGVVIIAFNRLDLLEMLFDSLCCQKNNNIKGTFLIYVDYDEEGVILNDVNSLKDKYVKLNLNFIFRTKQLGLKVNVIDSVNDAFNNFSFDEILLLEDDLLLSPFAFNYIEQIISVVQDDHSVFGLSLYAQTSNPWNNWARNLSGEFLLSKVQFPCSWGSIIKRKYWMKFSISLVNYRITNFSKSIDLPKDIEAWNRGSSWKYELVLYCIKHNLYYIYPNCNYSIHLGNVGTHLNESSGAPLNSNLVSNEIDYESFIGTNSSSFFEFDVFFELLPYHFKGECFDKIGNDFTVDLFGLKSKYQNKKYCLTIKRCEHSICDFGNDIACNFNNIWFNIPGNTFHLAESNEIISTSNYELYYKYFVMNFRPNQKKKLLFSFIKYMFLRIL